MTPSERSGMRSVVGERLTDLLLYVVCAAALTAELLVSPDAAPGPVGFGVVAVAALPVLWRRRAPVPAFAAALLLIFGLLDLAGIYVTVAVPAIVCAYALADRHGRRHAIIAGTVTIPTVLLMLTTYSPHPLVGWETAKNLSFVAVPLALGVAAHERRTTTRALLDRAEAAERTREEEARRRAGEERLRIARDVHDVVAHSMVAINVQSGVGAHLIDRDPELARTVLVEIRKASSEALGELRSMLGLLREGDADSDGDAGHDHAAEISPLRGVAQIAELREALRAAGVDLDVRLDPASGALPAALGATCYRIVQEALTNVMKHAGPTTARVRVACLDDDVHIEVENDEGTGPRPVVRAGSGNGIRGMNERAHAVGGTLTAGPREDGGWRVAASLPVGAR